MLRRMARQAQSLAQRHIFCRLGMNECRVKQWLRRIFVPNEQANFRTASYGASGALRFKPHTDASHQPFGRLASNSGCAAHRITRSMPSVTQCAHLLDASARPGTLRTAPLSATRRP